MTQEHKEEQKEAAPAAATGPLKERWVQWVALTTTVLAVCAAISSLKAGGYSTKVQLATARESDRWAQYQAKSIKQNLLSVEKSLLEIQIFEARSPDARQAIAKRLGGLDGEIGRYDKEKGELRADAEALQKAQAEYQRHGTALGLAVMLLQIAIMLSSVGALIKKPSMWAVGLLFGAAGLWYMASALLV